MKSPLLWNQTDKLKEVINTLDGINQEFLALYCYFDKYHFYNWQTPIVVFSISSSLEAIDPIIIEEY